jgi:hypothetical protein
LKNIHLRTRPRVRLSSLPLGRVFLSLTVSHPARFERVSATRAPPVPPFHHLRTRRHFFRKMGQSLTFFSLMPRAKPIEGEDTYVALIPAIQAG